MWRNRQNKTVDGNAALTIDSIQSEDSKPVLRIAPELPEMEVARVSLMYYAYEYPTQQQLVQISDYLEVTYELKCQSVSVDLASGVRSWTDPNAKFTVMVTLQGKLTK